MASIKNPPNNEIVELIDYLPPDNWISFDQSEGSTSAYLTNLTHTFITTQSTNIV